MEVKFKDIKVGEIYGIKWKKHRMDEKYIGKCISHSGSSGIFNLTISYYLNNERRIMYNDTIYYGGMDYNFFILGQKEKIQNEMEKRAFNKIIENIFGHPL
jgi:hypothetical protein